MRNVHGHTWTCTRSTYTHARTFTQLRERSYSTCVCTLTQTSMRQNIEKSIISHNLHVMKPRAIESIFWFCIQIKVRNSRSCKSTQQHKRRVNITTIHVQLTLILFHVFGLLWHEYANTHCERELELRQHIKSSILRTVDLQRFRLTSTTPCASMRKKEIKYALTSNEYAPSVSHRCIFGTYISAIVCA